MYVCSNISNWTPQSRTTNTQSTAQIAHGYSVDGYFNISNESTFSHVPLSLLFFLQLSKQIIPSHHILYFALCFPKIKLLTSGINTRAKSQVFKLQVSHQIEHSPSIIIKTLLLQIAPAC